MAKAGAKNVYFVCSTRVRFPNVYGRILSGRAIAHGREVEDINASIGADG